MTGPKPKIERIHPPKWLMRLGNPVMRPLASRGSGVARFVVVLHFTGRKSGRRFDLPVGYRLNGGRIMILTNSPWRHNFAGGRDIEVTYMGRRQPARATLVEDPAQVGDYYATHAERIGPKRVARELGMRINLERLPTRDEWKEALDREGMAIVWVDLKPE